MKAVLVMFDTLSKDFLSNYGNDWVKTPNFERLKEYTVTFDNFYGGSMPCMPARRELHTGRYNFLHRMWGPLEVFDQSVFEVLQKNGVYCHLITDHSHYFEDGGATYHNRYSSWEGFRGQEGDRWVPRLRTKIGSDYNKLNKEGISVVQHFANRTRQEEESELSSVKTVDAGLDFLEEYHDLDNWFLQIECFDPHEPFYVPEKYREKYQETVSKSPYFWPKYGRVTDDVDFEDLRELQNEYASLITMCDFHLGRILDFFDKHNLWDDTLLIVNTDHGLLLGEHGWLGKNIPPMYEEVIHLPFFISYPGITKGQHVSELAQTIDIPATLLDFFDIDNHLDMDGKSLLKLINDDTEIHDVIIFGTNGGHVSIYDGKYVYMRASQNKTNGPLKIQTTAFTLMRGFLPKDALDNMVLRNGTRFTNHYPYTEIEVPNYIDSYSVGNLLFDLESNPSQTLPLDDIEMEEKMVKKLVKVMKDIEAPKSEFIRLGLEDYL